MNKETWALVGNPNSGKSVLFNRFTGLNQKVANYPGVTVEKISGRFKYSSKSVEIVDLPGIYGLSNYSEDAHIAVDFLLSGKTKINRLILVIDSTNLSRSLILPLQLLAMNLPCILVLNMEDELKARGGVIDKKLLSKELGLPVFSISAIKGWGLNALIDYLKEQINTEKKGNNASAFPHVIKQKDQLELEIKSEFFAQKANVLGKKVIQKKIKSDVFSDKLDAILLHRVWGLLIFSLLFLFVFQSVFSYVTPLMDGVEAGFAWLGESIESSWKDSWYRNLLVEGVIGGVGSVLVFLPQITVLFFFIGLLEFSGYMSRASFVTDRFMNKVGLQGKSFLPLLSSYACAIPGVMATRSLESKRERLITIFISPFMTCSARLPVYILLITAFIPDKYYLGGIIGLRTLSFLFLYILGGMAAIGTAAILKKIWASTESLPFIQELPPYRYPTLRAIIQFVWQRVWLFLKKAGGIIFVITVLLWALASFPSKSVEQEGVKASYVGHIGLAIEPIIKPLGFDWKIGIGLVTSLAAREVVVSTLAIIYSINEENEDKLLEIIRRELNFAQGMSLLVFFIFALQCLATLAVVKRETGNWKLPVFMFIYMSSLAYLFSFVCYQGLNALM